MTAVVDHHGVEDVCGVNSAKYSYSYRMQGDVGIGKKINIGDRNIFVHLGPMGLIPGTSHHWRQDRLRSPQTGKVVIQI